MKKLISVFLLVVSIVSLFSMPVSASSQDSNFNFTFGVGGTENLDTYPTRKKDNDSSCYINYQYGSKTVMVTIYGTQTNGVIHRVGGAYPGIMNCMGSYNRPRVNVGRRGFIRQLVNEWGYDYAIMSGRGPLSTTCSGKWSPDSVPESGVSTLN